MHFSRAREAAQTRNALDVTARELDHNWRFCAGGTDGSLAGEQVALTEAFEPSYFFGVLHSYEV